MLSTVEHFVIGGSQVVAEVEGDVYDVARRIHEGDATVGWLGDDTLSLKLAVAVDELGRPLPNGDMRYEVWGVDEAGTPYLAIVWPRCDPSLLAELARSDVRTQDIAARIQKANAQVADTARARAADAMAENHDRLHFALMHDLGAYEGGLTRRVH